MQEKVSSASQPANPPAARSMQRCEDPCTPDEDLHKPLREIENANKTSQGNCLTITEEPGPSDQNNGDVQSQPEKPRLTIRQIREAAQSKVQARQESHPPTPPSVPPPKKKPSILGGLFQVREPTQVALNQVAAQLVAQHGSTSATKVPNVRLEKMPDFVPKVNSKWDGIPDGVKQMQKKEKEREKDRSKSSRRDGSGNTYLRTGSRDRRDDERGSLNSRTSSSTTDSLASRGRSSGSHTASARTRFYAPSANSSGDLASQHRTDRLLPGRHSRPSPSPTNQSQANSVDSVPKVRGLQREVDTVPSRSLSLKQHTTQDNGPSNPSIDGRLRVGQSVSAQVPPSPGNEPLPAHSASPVFTPTELSPVTPTFEGQPNYNHNLSAAPKENFIFTSSGPGVLGQPAVAHNSKTNLASGTFLAGEAQELALADNDTDRRMADLPENVEGNDEDVTGNPSTTPRKQKALEKRPDSSRARLGSRANMLVKEEVTPWEVQGKKQTSVSAQKPVAAASPRATPSPRNRFHKPFPFFGKDKDKSSA
ncbi:hypothetical protein A1O1_07933 [Capronia coronata CBS 617.96]|uniref:Uncharacterized protein n=1 Tax=Capronia coronata CBS 617.96 TaxID=1182541 RepID=W9XNU7_9EURO|nr:uncharacterized protein A1O1_07933 [Capronia coronata CBS 617.96]EXJ81868.1 hypothetical protein A1O1_07933 [Capronia coronata CBS 617.96]